MAKVDIQEVTRLVNKLEEKFNTLDIKSDVVRENVPKDFKILKEELKRNSSEERIINGLKIFVTGLRDYTIGNSNMNPIVNELEEYIRRIDTSDF